MDHIRKPPLHPGVAQKADAVVAAVNRGCRLVAAIAEATHLSETTVIRVAALLRDRGLVRVVCAGDIELLPSLPR